MDSDERRARVIARSAAEAHRECVSTDKKGGIAGGRSRRTHHRWRTLGYGSPIYEAQRYILRVDDPFRAVGSMMATAHQAALEHRTVEELRDRYRELIDDRLTAQAEVQRLMTSQVRDSTTAMALAAAEERAAGISAEVAALLRELQSRPGSPDPWGTVH